MVARMVAGMVTGRVQVLYRYGYVKVEGVGLGCVHSTVIVTEIVVVRVVGMVMSGVGAWCWLCYGYGMGCGDGYGLVMVMVIVEVH